MQGLASLGLAVPLLDEADLVDVVVRDLCLALDGAGVPFRLALVDNGSRDGTGARVAALSRADGRLLHVSLPQNQGYGGGILSGLRALWPLQVEGRPLALLGWTWGDGQVDPAVLPALVAACQAGADLARVHRVRREDGATRALVSAGYSLAARGLGLHLPDLNGCPKVFRRDTLVALDLRAADWFLDFEAVQGVHARGGTIHAEPAVMRPRPGGASKVRLATLAEFVRNLARWRLVDDPHGSRPLPAGWFRNPPGAPDAP